MRRLALLLGKINEGLIGNGLDEPVAQNTQRQSQRPDRLGIRNTFLNFLVWKNAVGANGTIIHERAAGDHLGSVSDWDVRITEAPVGRPMADPQFRDLRRPTGDGILMTLATGLSVI